MAEMAYRGEKSSGRLSSLYDLVQECQAPVQSLPDLCTTFLLFDVIGICLPAPDANFGVSI